MTHCSAKNFKLYTLVLRFTLFAFRSLGFCILIFAFLCGCSQQTLYKDSQLMMGTVVEVISPEKETAKIVFAEMRRIENLLSIHKEESEIARLNKQGKLTVSEETLYVIKKAAQFWQTTDGAFDITVAPLVELWGFLSRNFHVPEEAEIKETLERVGLEKVEINENIIKFRVDGMEIDLGAIAKGFAVDCAIKKLKEAGIVNALINAGGDIYCLGDRFGKPWRVKIRNTDTLLKLKDKAVATSGGDEQYFSIGKRRFCHILNPKTGMPVESEIRSVTVITDHCLTADALATVIFVKGLKEAQVLVDSFNAEAIIDYKTKP
ncbi:MAG: FAD:protein FMN transferase [Candidatus Omnitrophica bacterium]|nr:FAD:protein FMN transferase [Candidatus Omnitrophota bacterium]